MSNRWIPAGWMLALALAVSVWAAAPETGPELSIREARARAPAGERVTIRGVIHTLLPQGLDYGARGVRFLIQDPSPDFGGNDSPAILVALDSRPLKNMAEELRAWQPRVGDEVVLGGRVRIARGGVRLSLARVVRIVARGRDPARVFSPVVVAPPDDEKAAAAWWRAQDGRWAVVRAESQVTGPLKGAAGIPRGEIGVIPAGHVLLQQTNVYARRLFRDRHAMPDAPPAGSLGAQGMTALLVPPADTPALTPRTFDRLQGDAAGGLVSLGGRPLVLLAAPPVFARGPDPSAHHPPVRAAAPDEIRIATFNIENLYDFTDDPFDPEDFHTGDGRIQSYVPASEEAYRLRIAGLARQIAVDLAAPDLLALQEIEDQDIRPAEPGSPAKNNADGVPDVLADLCAEIRKQGGPGYDAGLDRRGADTRGITCGFLWRTDRLCLAPERRDDPLLGDDPNRAVPKAPEARVEYDPAATRVRALNKTLPGKGPLLSRGIQAAAFQRAGGSSPARLYVLVSHFKSQPLGAIEFRRAQAAFAAALARALMAGDPQARVIVAGDLNTYPRPDDPTPQTPADTLGPLYQAGLVNLYDRMARDGPYGAYTYIFRGVAQTLDQFFVSPALNRRLRDVRVFHINSDYTFDPAVPGRGVSDHDPVVATFSWE